MRTRQDETEPKEKDLSSGNPAVKSSLTLQQAIDFGEYDPQFLANFAEWHTLSIHIQWQMIKTALDNRRKQLVVQYAELSNVLNFSKKPEIHQACDNVFKQLQALEKDREDLYIEYSNKI
ncbi:MAG: hypothetical protein ABID04_00220 [Patescibacteria group bacterium]